MRRKNLKAILFDRFAWNMFTEDEKKTFLVAIWQRIVEVHYHNKSNSLYLSQKGDDIPRKLQ